MDRDDRRPIVPSIGGGTPSLTPLSALWGILHVLLHLEDAPFRLEGDDDDPSEVTIRMDSGSFDLAYLASVK